MTTRCGYCGKFMRLDLRIAKVVQDKGYQFYSPDPANNFFVHKRCHKKEQAQPNKAVSK